MKFQNAYQSRPIRFLECYQHQEWTLKIYSISSKKSRVNEEDVILAKTYLEVWLQQCVAYKLETYKIATLILHEFKEGCFAVINWWTDENMLQNFVYLKQNNTNEFVLYSDRGMASCVWEMAIWWHERNAWVKHVLMQSENPDFEAYLLEQFNADI
jgi:hypothetical protein